MKVRVTGGCGFLGSHVCEFYRKLGWEVIAYDNMTKHELNRTGFAAEAARSFNWDFLTGLGVQLVQADVRDAEQLLDYAHGCNYIIHTAAQPAMTISWEDPAARHHHQCHRDIQRPGGRPQARDTSRLLRHGSCLRQSDQ